MTNVIIGYHNDIKDKKQWWRGTSMTVVKMSELEWMI